MKTNNINDIDRNSLMPRTMIQLEGAVPLDPITQVNQQF